MLGFPYGMMYALIPMVCLDWFGMGLYLFVHSITNSLFLNTAHFSENWGYLCVSPVIASSVFALAFGRISDAHEGHLDRESMHSPRSGPATQCMQGKECYVAALYLTAGACFVPLLLSVWAALRDRRNIRDGMEARLGREVGWEAGYLTSDA